MRRASVAVATNVLILASLALPARATFHIMVINQVFPGLPQAPAAQFVTLQMQAPLQIQVYGQPFPVFDAQGNALTPFASFCSTPSHASCSLPTVSPACADGGCPDAFGANGSHLLIATRWAQDLFCVTADLLAGGSLPQADGRVCFGDCSLRTDCGQGPVDCVAYGDYTGDNAPFGTPAMSPMLGEALVASPDRTNQFIGGNLLDDSAGFSLGAPTPQNFHGDVGALDGLAGDPLGNGLLAAANVAAEVDVLFEADRRCDLPTARRGADANFDGRINAADLVATLRIVAAG